MGRKWFQVVCVFAAAVCVGLSGCASMKAAPSQGAGFVPMDELANREDLPFNKVWIKDNVDWDQYKMIHIKDINTMYLMKASWWQKNFRREDMQQDVVKIAVYMKDQFTQAFKKDPMKRFEVVNKPLPGSLTLEMALTELVPSNPVLEAVSIAAPYGGGVAVQAVAKESGAKATVAFEGKLMDSATGAVLAMFVDREQGKVAPINLRALSWYGESEKIINEWADQFVQVANKRPGEVVKSSSPFTLMPW